MIIWPGRKEAREEREGGISTGSAPTALAAEPGTSGGIDRVIWPESSNSCSSDGVSSRHVVATLDCTDADSVVVLVCDD